MKKNLIFVGFLLSLTLYGQVGIKTDTPQKSLHVNGSLQITNEFNVGGDARTAGSAGSAGQVLMSHGAGAAPTWNSLQGLSGQTSLGFNVFSSGKSVNGSSAFNSIPGLNYNYTAPADGVLLIQANIYTALGEASGSGSLVFSNTQIVIKVNGIETFYGMSTPIGHPSAGMNPETTVIIGKINVTKGAAYAFDIVAKDVYKFGGTTGAYAGTFTWNTYSSQSSIVATLIAN
ncbi:hypothetical protein J2795_003760 [Chryseobacterium bernardetii]|jgi:hypothetical protein|uniref:Uncharacterized protein n=3 Tax=Chryseobacterium TaxID=59732 RepID=A0A543E4N5_9FLAO|nr:MULTISPECIES: hypothetical protein [Chryseobacterium]MDR6372811.1 hypothetical protein [Chryseobacterium vietnamense]MDR6443029.1 hypothetical protein [Chryseobacterium bernardetii]MDR6460991.1 hypothetical protein [Chryseobacterium vietnamense]TQM16521.1 hypothetical protein FB551_4404 [Chryseobacterium aquifrigidense]